MPMLSKQIEGLREEINQMFPEYYSQAETMQRLIETGNHAQNLKSASKMAQSVPMSAALQSSTSFQYQNRSS